MKKKLSSLLLALVMLFSVSACGVQESEELAGAVLDAALDAAINAVENYEASSTPEDHDELLDDMLGESETPKDPNQELNELINSLRPESSAPDDIGVIGGDTFTIYLETLEEDGYYYDLEHVVLYLDHYGELPDNYITKSEARKLGWEGGTPERYLEGSAIGGDSFGNREGLLPDGDYTECDLNTLGKDSRGAERLVFSDDGHYYHTEDHYESFTEVWIENGEVVSE